MSGVDSVAAARALLPGYVLFGPLVSASALGALLGAVCMWIAARIAGEPALALTPAQAAELPWTERARRVYPLRISLAFATILVPWLVGFVTWMTVGPLSRVSSGIVGLCSAASAFFAVVLVGKAVSRGVPEALRRPSRSRGKAMAHLLIRPHWLILAVTFVVLPPRFNLRAWITLGVAAALILAVMWGRQLVVARWLGLARPAGEKLAEAVRLAEERIGVRARRTVEIPLAGATALAFPLAHELLFSEVAVDILDVEELAAIAAHELGHIAEKWRVSFFGATGPLMALPLTAARPAVGTPFGMWTLLAVEVSVLASVIMLRRLARRREERADRVAQTHETAPGRYATALERLYRHNLVPAVMGSRRHIHPHLYDRLTAAGVVPDYPRPEPPSRARIRGALAVVVCLPLLVTPTRYVAAFLMRKEFPRDGTALLRAAALDGGNAWTLGVLGFVRSGKPDAVTLFRACAILDGADTYCERALCTEFARGGHCGEATRAADEALERARRSQAPAAVQALRNETQQALDYCHWLAGQRQRRR